MERNFCTVEELIKSGKIRKGDFVEYVPTVGKYVTKKEETGWEPEVIETDLNAKWIFHGYDEEKKSFCIKTADGVNEVTLSGSIGFVRGPEVLHAICKECYSIPEKGIYARSMVVEDYNEETGFVLPEKPNRFAFYPCGSKVSGEIEYNGKMYKKVECYQFVRFYMCDSGGKEEVDKNGIVYRKPLKNKPVFVTETYYYNNRAINISKCHWLASPCVSPNSSGADLRVRYASSSGVYAYLLYVAGGSTYSISRGVRPLVSLSSMLRVDITDEHRDGSSREKAWKLVISNDVNDNDCTNKEIDTTAIETSENIPNKTDMEESKYKIVRVQDKDLMTAFDKLENEVNKLIWQGFEIVDKFEMYFQNNTIILMQQVIKK